jgi:hypothetical protein
MAPNNIFPCSHTPVRQSDFARDEKQFLNTPNPSPASTPRGTPDDMSKTSDNSAASTPRPYSTPDEVPGEHSSMASDQMSV